MTLNFYRILPVFICNTRVFLYSCWLLLYYECFAGIFQQYLVYQVRKVRLQVPLFLCLFDIVFLLHRQDPSSSTPEAFVFADILVYWIVNEGRWRSHSAPCLSNSFYKKFKIISMTSSLRKSHPTLMKEKSKHSSAGALSPEGCFIL